jgi:hypothetical protein
MRWRKQPEFAFATTIRMEIIDAIATKLRPFAAHNRTLLKTRLQRQPENRHPTTLLSVRLPALEGLV